MADPDDYHHQKHLEQLEHNQQHYHRRIPTSFDELAADDDKKRLTHLLSRIHPDDQDILRAHFAAEATDRLHDLQHRLLWIIEQVIRFCVFPFVEWAKVWAVIYALDLSLHDGMNMQRRARKLGVTRAAISIYAREFIESTGFPPSRWMRAETTVQRARGSRIHNLTQPS